MKTSYSNRKTKTTILSKTFLLFFIVSVVSIKSNANNGFTVFTLPTNTLISNSGKDNNFDIDNLGRKVFCSSNLGLIVFDGINYTTYDTANSNIPTNKLKGISIDTNNMYWIATVNEGIFSFDGTTFTNLDSSNSAIPFNTVNAISARNNRIYFLHNNDGFFEFYNGQFTHFTTANSSLNSDTISDIKQDFNGNLWLATDSGLCKFDGTNFTTYYLPYTNTHSNSIKSIFIDGSTIWIISQSLGLIRFENGIFKALNELHDAPLHINVLTNTFYSNYGRSYMSKGPRGGILFCQANRFIEIANRKIYSYEVTDSNLNNEHIFTNKFPIHFESTSNSVWMLYKSNFIRFKISDYNGFAYGNNSQNCKAIDINKVYASISNRGDMFGNSEEGSSNYEIPKGSGKKAVFTNALWIGGIDAGGDLHVAAQTYRQTGVDFWPGPLDTVTGAATTNSYIAYDKIWKIDRFYIEQFKHYFQIGAVQNGTWMPNEDFLNWPARGTGNYTRNMAPFVDVNNNGIYDPLMGGDYPKIKGDQMLYWIFNDNFANHTETNGTPLKVEVHASAYAFTCPNASNADSAINYTTFYNYKVFNRSSNAYNNCYIGNFSDSDIGNPYDDAGGCNKIKNLSYTYNFDDFDETEMGYGSNAPMIGNVILNGPEPSPNDGIDNDNDGIIDNSNEKCLMNSCINFYNNGTSQGNPYNGTHIWNYLQAKWKDSSHLMYGGNGYTNSTQNPTNFMYSSLPPFDSTSWINTDAGDMRSLQGSGPFTFIPGASFDYDFAIVYARDTVGAQSPQLFQQLFDNADKAKVWFDNNTFPSCLEINTGVAETKKDEPNKLFVFPNPAQNTLSFQLEKSQVVVSYNIYNMLGDAVITNNIVSTNSIDISELNSGVYFLTIKDKNGKLYNNKFVKR